jgi:hypothetical protein
MTLIHKKFSQNLDVFKNTTERKIFKFYLKEKNAYKLKVCPLYLIKNLNQKEWGIFRKHLRIIRNSKVCDKSVYMNHDGSFKIDIILKLFLNYNSSIVIYGGNNIPENIPYLKYYFSKFKNQVGFKNAYWNLFITPPNSVCIDAHFDAHDLLLIQIYGEKKWEIWKPYTEIQQYDIVPPIYKERTQKHISINRKCEITLKESDILILPRLFVHKPFTMNMASIHLSIFSTKNGSVALSN